MALNLSNQNESQYRKNI